MAGVSTSGLNPFWYYVFGHSVQWWGMLFPSDRYWFWRCFDMYSETDINKYVSHIFNRSINMFHSSRLRAAVAVGTEPPLMTVGLKPPCWLERCESSGPNDSSQELFTNGLGAPRGWDNSQSHEPYRSTERALTSDFFPPSSPCWLAIPYPIDSLRQKKI